MMEKNGGQHMNKKMKVVAITNDHKVEVKEVRRPDVKPAFI